MEEGAKPSSKKKKIILQGIEQKGIQSPRFLQYLPSLLRPPHVALLGLFRCYGDFTAKCNIQSSCMQNIVLTQAEINLITEVK